MPIKSENECNRTMTLIKTGAALCSLGGLFEEVMEEAYEYAYPEFIREIADMYMEKGVGYNVLAETIEEAINTVSKYYGAFNALQESDTEQSRGFLNGRLRSSTLFENWATDRVAYFEAERIKSGRRYFWETSGLSKKERRTFDGFTALDEKVLVLYYGFGQAQSLTQEEIAAFPEFSCKPEYVNAVLEYVFMAFKPEYVNAVLEYVFMAFMRTGLPPECYFEKYDKVVADNIREAKPAGTRQTS